MIRTIVTATDNTLLVSIPEEYIGKQAEVIAFTLDEVKPLNNRATNSVSPDAIKPYTSEHKFNREEANEQ